MSNRRISDVTKGLIAAKERISKPKNWLKEMWENNNGGFCALGAIGEIAGNYYSHQNYSQMRNFLIKALPKTIKRAREPGEEVIYYNNDPATTHHDIIALFDKAISLSILKDQKTNV